MLKKQEVSRKMFILRMPVTFQTEKFHQNIGNIMKKGLLIFQAEGSAYKKERLYFDKNFYRIVYEIFI